MSLRKPGKPFDVTYFCDEDFYLAPNGKIWCICKAVNGTIYFHTSEEFLSAKLKAFYLANQNPFPFLIIFFNYLFLLT